MRTETQARSVPTGKVGGSPDKVLVAAAASASASGKSLGAVVSSGMSTALELRNPPMDAAKANAANIPQPCQVLPSEAWIQVLCADGISFPKNISSVLSCISIV